MHGTGLSRFNVSCHHIWTKMPPLKLKLCSWNIRGLRSNVKRRKVYSLLKRERVDVALLQESHLDDNEHLKLKYSWVGQVYFSSFTTSSRGVVILIHKNLPFQLKKSIKDKYVRFVIVNGVLNDKEITIMNLYCPPNYSLDLLTKAFSEFAEVSSPLALVGGDFNCLLNPRLDRHPPRNSPVKSG